MKKMSVVLMVVLLSGIVMMTACGTKEKAVTEENSVTEKTENQKETDESTDIITEECKQEFVEAQYLTLEKVERTITEEGESYAASYDSYIVSDLNLKEGTDKTDEYADAMDEEEFDDTKVKSVSFKDAFGIDYADKNAWELFEGFLAANEMDADLNDADFDEETNSMTKQKLYVLNQDSSILNHMLKGVSYDELLEKKVFYQMAESEDGVQIPECFQAMVQYRVGDQIVTKTLYLQISINSWNQEEGE